MDLSKPRYFERTILFIVGGALCGFAVAALRLHPAAASFRVAYGLDHLAPALGWSGVFCFVLGLTHLWLRNDGFERLDRQSTGFLMAAIGLTFCAFWLPVVVCGGFVQDDWLLLAGASVRKVILAHPAASWVAVDSVDGNFRPLGTVLYFGYMYKAFGLAPHVFLTANFLLNLGSVFVGFLIVREMGYSKAAAGIAAILYLSRGLLYTQAAWASALGDCIVTLLTGIVVLLLLKAIRREGWRAGALHGTAWLLFAVSTLAKQSSFTTPAIVVALLALRPGVAAFLPWRDRMKQAGAAAAAYGGVVLAIYAHARALLGNVTPYPVGLSWFGTLRTFAYGFWYFETLYVPSDKLVARSHPAGLFDLGGATLAVLLCVLLYRKPGLMGERPRDLLFLLIAGLCSVSLFVLLKSRNEAYYGAMLAFWLSLGFGILVTGLRSPGPRRMALLGVSALVGLGFLDVRMKEIGLVWTGGYFWGDADVWQDAAHFAELQRIVQAAPEKQTAVLIDAPIQARFYRAMLTLAAPQLTRILLYDSASKTYLVNDLEGSRPRDGVAALQDVEEYEGRIVLDPARASALTAAGPTLWIRLREGHFVVDQGDPAVGRDATTH